MVMLKAFPVPAQNEISLHHPGAVKGNRILINGIDGRTIKSLNAQEGVQQTTIDISTLNRGTYFIRYLDDTGSSEILKITKQ